MYPVVAPITSPFGYRTHPILGYQKFHAGKIMELSSMPQIVATLCLQDGMEAMAMR